MKPAATHGRERSEPSNRRGYIKLRRGLPELDGDTPMSDKQWNYERSSPA